MITFSQLGRYGRLGNQMFQIASTIGIAIKNGYDYAFPEWKNYDAAERFGSKEDIDVQKWFKNRLPTLSEEHYGPHTTDWVYNSTILKRVDIPFGFHGFDIPDNISLSGHMQSEKYFEHCEDVVRNYFEFAHQLKDENDIWCAIHIRLGDYCDHQGYHPVQTKEYYEEAINKIGANKHFMLFSDDNEKARKLFSEWFGNKYYILFPHKRFDEIQDMKFMTACKNFITSNSTFSWWAAWLSKHPDKKIIQPSNWFGPEAGLDAKDIYIKNAIVI